MPPPPVLDIDVVGDAAFALSNVALLGHLMLSQEVWSPHRGPIEHFPGTFGGIWIWGFPEHCTLLDFLTGSPPEGYFGGFVGGIPGTLPQYCNYWTSS